MTKPRSNKPQVRHYPPLDKADLFWNKVVKQPGRNGCWEWHFPTKPMTTFSWVDGQRPNHKTRAIGIRWAALHFAGVPIDDDCCIMPKCGNRDCVRPDHIEQLSKSETVMKYTPPERRGLGGPKRLLLSDAALTDIWCNPDQLGAVALGLRYKVHANLINDIQNGRSRREDIERLFGPQQRWGRFRLQVSEPRNADTK